MKYQSQKAINFDLNTKKLKEHFKNTAEAYMEIKNFFLKNNFEHRQYSGYISKEFISKETITDIMEDLRDACPWIGDCVKEIDVTDISAQYSLKDIFTSETSKEIENSKKRDHIKSKVLDVLKSNKKKQNSLQNIKSKKER